jgi:uncharacterized protein (UPF0332 family)
VHGERALLAVEKRSPPDFRSVHRMCTLHFLQNGQIDARHRATADRLLELRAQADDQPLRTFGADDAADAAASASAFVGAVEAWLETNGYAVRR